MLVTQLVTGFGLAGAAGLNAYIPLLVLGVLGRFEVVSLQGPFEILMHPAVLAVTSVLLAIELAVDKVPALDHVNDVLQTFVRPVAGAIVFAAGSGALGDVSPPVLLVCGLVTAFGVHSSKAIARPVVHAASLGTGGPVVSAAEDVLSAAASLLALFAPLVGLTLFAVVGLVGFRLILKWNRAKA
jgi:hypothetical protein